ncbi:MAG: hypothetical protein AB7S74_17705 [Hyphomicrobium sp.]
MALSLKGNLAVLALAALSGGLVPLMPVSDPAERYLDVVQRPKAALAWAQAQCASGADLQNRAARVQAEDLMLVSSQLDSAVRNTSLEHACRQALDAAHVASTSPQDEADAQRPILSQVFAAGR